MLFRQHRGGFKESMDTVQELDNSKEALINKLNEILKDSSISATLDNVAINNYSFDKRNNWETFAVSIKGYGVIGFVNEIPK